jgi:hypothetical protein
MAGCDVRFRQLRTYRRVRRWPLSATLHSCTAAIIARLFEQCVGSVQERFTNCEAHGLGSLQVNGQLELRGLLYR